MKILEKQYKTLKYQPLITFSYTLSWNPVFYNTTDAGSVYQQKALFLMKDSPYNDKGMYLSIVF